MGSASTSDPHQLVPLSWPCRKGPGGPGSPMSKSATFQPNEPVRESRQARSGVINQHDQDVRRILGQVPGVHALLVYRLLALSARRCSPRGSVGTAHILWVHLRRLATASTARHTPKGVMYSCQVAHPDTEPWTTSSRESPCSRGPPTSHIGRAGNPAVARSWRSDVTLVDFRCLSIVRRPAPGGTPGFSAPSHLVDTHRDGEDEWHVLVLGQLDAVGVADAEPLLRDLSDLLSVTLDLVFVIDDVAVGL